MAAPYFEFHNVAPFDTPRFYSAIGKRVLDVALVVLALPLVLPLVASVLCLTALSGGRPLYSQKRIGRDGLPFRCWKVRTMIPDAESVLARILQADPTLAAEWGRTQKLSRDPRITRLGAVLRRTSLDELPQLWNVLTGSMSLVGPRPFLPEQRALYLDGRQDAAYYRMRPGITGLWQIGCRNRGSFSERANYDTAYGHSVSLGTDLSVLARTFGAVMRATGV
ncbi:sugar transferase [Defluviimonas sp. WL0024]|uniref:Sugar transferase n=2 Tax=Albidovulum TaxID=205889 RepID=A0ABT3J1B4_9RHOB|nr:MULTISPECIES: sugar transferase [Defluviimonas]MCU9848093.1 sugar transferase [Defluviimonas sp. WL0024]MCW3781477.1 sugar transferase [Defluviimonas salinarum]